jgi:DNA polymerase-3 subunit alpha
LISTEGDPTQKALYIENARYNKIKVVAPDINRSIMDFTVGEDDSILFGFNSVKGIGEKAALKIIGMQPFNSFGDFLIKAHHAKGVNKKTLESLIYCGAFDCFGIKKSALLSGFGSFIFDYVNSLKDATELEHDIQVKFINQEKDYFDNKIPELSFLEVLDKEKELLGIYLSSSPFGFIRKNTKYKNLQDLSVIEQLPANTVNILCRIETIKVFVPKSGKTMCFIDATDENNVLANFVIFGDVFKKIENKIKNKIYAVIKASVRQKKDSSRISLIVNDIIDLTEELTESIKKIEFKNAIRSISLVFEGIPSSARVKSIQSIIVERNTPDSRCKVNLLIKLNDKYKVNIGNFMIDKIDVNFLQAFSKIKDVYVVRDNNG